MYEVFTECPHCKQETKATFDIVNEGREEGYENICSSCKQYFLYIILAKTQQS